jgi:p-hydroxybenzoate 3-monooxygenase
LHALDTDQPIIFFHNEHREYQLISDFVIGCDGYNGVSRKAIPADLLDLHETIYPDGWLCVLSTTPPLKNVIYAHHQRGFALASQRSAMLSRYYIQVPSHTHLKDWSDDRFWYELKSRFPDSLTNMIITGPIIEKSIALLRSSIAQQVRYNRLFLIGDAAHILPSTGAKGLNLVVSDAFHLARALTDYYQHQATRMLDDYNEQALHRVHYCMKTAAYLTKLLHRFNNQDGFNLNFQRERLKQLKASPRKQALLAIQYAGFTN